jgi:DNA repair protein RadD
MNLRPYQRSAVDAVYNHLRERADNPLVVIPTGGGKTPIIATICREVCDASPTARIMVVAHVKELLEQAVDKLRAVAPQLPVGVYSAGLGRREMEYAVTVAGIQSVFRKVCDFGRLDLIIIDEAHMVPAEDDGMYRTFIAGAKAVNPDVRVVGLTATPYRLKDGLICGPGNILNHICYEVGVRDLVNEGFLSPLRSKRGLAQIDADGIGIRAGEFIASEVEAAMDDAVLVQSAVDEILQRTADRVGCLIFAAGVAHAGHIADEFKRRDHVCEIVTGSTPDAERAAILERFKTRATKYLANVNVLTTGFDAPHVDCVALLRPTMSPGLYYQMVGRGFRLSPGKADCLVLDFGGNVLRHGPIDAMSLRMRTPGTGGEAPAKECPGCMEVVAAGFRLCPECGHEFPPPEKKAHTPKADSTPVMTTEVIDEEHPVMGVTYHRHEKKADPSAPPTMRVEYQLNYAWWQKEWVCFEHTGFPRRKAEGWWRDHGGGYPAPATVEEALSRTGELRKVVAIKTRTKGDSKFPEIIGFQVEREPGEDDVEPSKLQQVLNTPGAIDGALIPEDEIPF